MYISALIFLPLISDRGWKTRLKNKLLLATTYLVGVVVVMLPTFVFELRHGFMQTQSMLSTLTKTVIYDSDVVGQTGIPVEEISVYFFDRARDLLQFPVPLSQVVIVIFIASILLHGLLKRNSLQQLDRRLLLLIPLSLGSVLLIYLSSNNPVWHYHFVGVEVLFLLFFGLVLARYSALQVVFGLWVLYLSVGIVKEYSKTVTADPLSFDSLASKQAIVEQIYQDADGDAFVYAAYSSAIYTFDFDYLFGYIAERDGRTAARTKIDTERLVYLIIPETEKAIELDFINYKTANDLYETSNEWKAGDGTLVLRRKIRDSTQ